MSEWEWAHVAIGAVASIIFLIQTLGTAGSEGDADSLEGDFDPSDGDTSGGLYEYLSVRNFVAFFIGYGWVTLAGLLSGMPRTISSALGIGAGVAFVFVSLALIRTFLRLQEDGNLNMEGLAGKSATVYIAIGGAGGKTGKVMVDTGKGRMELPARTMGDALKPGEFVRIEKVEDGTLWVFRPKGDA